MDTPQTPASADKGAFSEADFLAWLGESGTPALISERHNRFYAHCYCFGIAGTGHSREEAIEDVTRLLMQYLTAAFSEGCSYEEAKKSPPVSVRLRTWYLKVGAGLLRGIKPLSRVGQLISVPTGSAGGHARRRIAH